MKLLLQDVSDKEIELEEPEITIVDKRNPERSYRIIPKGGYILITARDLYKIFDVDMKTTIEVINVDYTPNSLDNALMTLYKDKK